VLLETYLSDNTKARELRPDGRYAPIDPGAEAFNAQTYFVDRPGIE
jgi:polyphosphate kinase